MAADPSAFVIPGTDDDVVEGYRTLAQRAATARFGLLEPDFVVIDTETTGLKVGGDELIEIAAAIMNGPEVVDTFQTFVNPGAPIPELIVELTSITDGDVAGAPGPDEAVAMLEEFVGQRMLVAHNASFDHAFVSAHASPASTLSDRECWIDTLGLSRIAFPRLRAHDQATLSDAFGVDRGNHRAIGDVLALSKLWRIMLAALDDMPHEMLGFIASVAPSASWPARRVIEWIAGEGAGKPFSMHSLRDRRIRACGGASPDPDDAPPDEPALFPIERGQLEQAFSYEGVVGAMYPRFEHRPEQLGFAFEVAEAFRTSTHRVIEAGTGVGKSISYLLPAVLFAKRNHVRVGVATKTNTLLDQLVYRELPLLRRALREVEGLDFSFISLKGYDHYPCLRKLMRYARELDGEDVPEYEIVAVCAVIAAVGQAVWGDLDALSISMNSYIKSRLACSSEECLHGKCSYFRRCLLHGARRRAFSSDVVVTNHALLFRDVAMEGGVLPQIRYWIVDEAHGMEDEARDQFAHSVDAYDLLSLLRKLGSGSGPLAEVESEALGLEGGDGLVPLVVAAKAEVEPTRALAEAFFRLVKGLGKLGDKSSYAVSELWVGPEVRETPQWGGVVSAGESLLRQIDRLASECRTAVAAASAFEELSAVTSELSTAASRLSETLASLSLILDGSNQDFYYYARIHSDPSKLAEQLSAALVDLGGELAQRFFPVTNSVILTSATIAVGDSFDYFTHRVGLDRVEASLWSASRLEPAEGFYANMRTIVVSDLPEPRSPGYSEELERLVLAVHRGLRGGVLTLFTNRREMMDLYERVNPVLKAEGIELLCQSAGKSKRMLSDEFTAREDACLFAMRSFWEGFDAPGRTLRCVLLPKLPFSRPDDPLYQERNARRNDAWKSFVLPQAIIDTKQAAGRLIRSRDDAGFLILGDRRLTSKWYGKVFLASFPAETLSLASIGELEDLLGSSSV